MCRMPHSGKLTIWPKMSLVRLIHPALRYLTVGGHLSVLISVDWGAGGGIVVAIWVMYRLLGITNNNNNYSIISEKPLGPGQPRFSQLDSKIRCKDLNAI